MKAKDKKELHSKSTNELLKLLKDNQESLLKYKLEQAQNKLKNTRNLFTTRRMIAVLRTILREKELIKNV